MIFHHLNKEENRSIELIASLIHRPNCDDDLSFYDITIPVELLQYFNCYWANGSCYVLCNIGNSPCEYIQSVGHTRTLVRKEKPFDDDKSVKLSEIHNALRGYYTTEGKNIIRSNIVNILKTEN